MSQIQHEQLKPCPFCADADALQHSMITGAVFCEGCGCEGPWAPHFDGDWNTRATVTVQDAARALVAAVNAGAIDPFDCTDLSVEALAIKHAGNRRDGVGQLEIAEEFFVAALTAIAEGRA